ncbi:calcium/sodium antiporter [Endozoicomonas sp. SM1973]|uniref:Calcium/sodium antiporter n=1 Tax=Spartinivicinus marinus TaxID=2994442 RepID=A0A853I2Z5_9GAMM|nr:calcium/sodium antiporter [Spartinivicinus marinus]MCX4029650.1 calcium/sodium antiporter [Spartinivicinus marinus]NYZ66969.1 calcium/sodium antiporter [Spartinivicinus marinus]
MILFTIAIIAGLLLLVWSADRFVFGAAVIAHRFNVSPLLIGITIVSVGTSAPEIIVSTMAGLSGAGSLAVGNALGSNIANIGLVLGVTALISPILLEKGLIKRELPLLLIVTLVTGYLLYDHKLTVIDSIILLLFLLITLYVVCYKNSLDSSQADNDVIDQEEATKTPLGKTIGWFLVGLIILLLSARLLVWGATNIATSLGISELVIGLTIVAIGTSLPELAASVASAVKGHHGMAIGNVVGSNLFNLLAVMPIPGLIATTWVEPGVFSRDYFVLLLSTMILFAILVFFKQKNSLGHFAGSFLVVGYSSYLLWLYQTHQSV